MDMSFSPRNGQPLAAPRLDYRTLVAGLATRAQASASDEVTHAGSSPKTIAIAGDLCLAAVILGRPGWRLAAQALGGGFAPGARS